MSNNTNIGEKDSSSVGSHGSTHSYAKKGRYKKIWYPFNCPPETRHVYSQLCHLTPDTRSFALSLAESTNIKIEEHMIDPNDASYQQQKRIEARKLFQDKVSSLSNVYQKSYHQSSSSVSKNGNDSNAPCKEKACQEMIQAVVQTRNLFKIENIEIQKQFEELSLQLENNENKYLVLEEKKEQMDEKTIELEEILRKKTLELEKVIAQNVELITERDSFNSKFIHLEYKIQSLMRQHQDASSKLYSVLWGDDIHRDNSNMISSNIMNFKSLSSNNISSHMKIKSVSEKDIMSSTTPSMTSYNSLVREDVVDTTEKLPSIPSLPNYFVDSIVLPSIHAGKSLSYYSKSKHVKKIIAKNKSLYSDSVSSYPFSRNSHGMHSSRSVDESSRSSMSGRKELLDPVFFKESARINAFRGSTVGKIRMYEYDTTPELGGRHGTSNGILLTNKHPGLELSIP